jgi:hypothetical protein
MSTRTGRSFAQISAFVFLFVTSWAAGAGKLETAWVIGGTVTAVAVASGRDTEVATAGPARTVLVKSISLRSDVRFAVNGKLLAYGRDLQRPGAELNA